MVFNALNKMSQETSRKRSFLIWLYETTRITFQTYSIYVAYFLFFYKYRSITFRPVYSIDRSTCFTSRFRDTDISDTYSRIDSRQDIFKKRKQK